MEGIVTDANIEREKTRTDYPMRPCKSISYPHHVLYKYARTMATSYK
jgi:hypothetical protein